MTLKSLLLAAAFALAVFAAPAPERKDEKKQPPAKVSGYLLDNVCASSPHEGEDEEVDSHMVSCALMEECTKSGFAVVSDGKVYKLDEKGNKLALRLLRGTRVRQGLTVTVAGTLDGDTLRAELITETR